MQLLKILTLPSLFVIITPNDNRNYLCVVLTVEGNIERLGKLFTGNSLEEEENGEEEEVNPRYASQGP